MSETTKTSHLPKLVHRLRDQLKQNAVAIASIAVALAGLGYNTWRNERSEHNRPLRISAFEVLHRTHDLQQLVFYQRYDHDSNKGNPRSGWSQVLIINDLAHILPPPLPQRALRLQETWQANWDHIADSQASTDAVLAEVDALRIETLAVIKNLR